MFIVIVPPTSRSVIPSKPNPLNLKHIGSNDNNPTSFIKEAQAIKVLLVTVC